MVRELPADDQNEAAEIQVAIAAKARAPILLDEQTRVAIRAGREQARRGEFVSDADMTAFFERYGVRRTIGAKPVQFD